MTGEEEECQKQEKNQKCQKKDGCGSGSGCGWGSGQPGSAASTFVGGRAANEAEAALKCTASASLVLTSVLLT